LPARDAARDYILTMTGFFEELQKRKVYRVAAAYIIAAGFLIQIASAAFPAWELPNWSLRLVIAVLLIGFPIALLLAWAYDITTHGIQVTPQTPGTHRRRNLLLLIAIGVVVSAAAGFFLLPRAVSQKIDKSIAVLPFENLSSDPDNAYFAEGVQDEILTRLAKIGELKVIARSSTQRYESSGADPREIGKQLGVAHVLEGSVQKAADNVRVRVQLINAATATHLWAESYDRKLTDIFAVESEIATKVAGALRAKLTPPEQNALSGRPTENTEAYQLYLLGRYFWNKRTAADFEKAIEYFNRAIEKDPNYALAYAGLADAYVLLSAYGEARPSDTFPAAKAAAIKAFELDPTLGEAHAALGMALFAYDLKFAEARREFQRAIELNPNYATAHQWYAECGLTPFRKFDEAIAEAKRALELDPLSVIINADVGSVLGYAGHHDEAIAQLRKTVEMDPNFYYSRWQLGEALEIKGFNEEAATQYKKAIELNDDPLPRALLGHLYARTGRRDEAREILRQLRELSKQRYVLAFNLALIHVGLDEKDAAIDLLEQAYAQRDGYNIGFIKVDPWLDPLRDDSRFEALVKKIFGGE
jgi:TolB-like protein/Tfp pilus assembly protein PilF